MLTTVSSMTIDADRAKIASNKPKKFIIARTDIKEVAIHNDAARKKEMLISNSSSKK